MNATEETVEELSIQVADLKNLIKTLTDEVQNLTSSVSFLKEKISGLE